MFFTYVNICTYLEANCWQTCCKYFGCYLLLRVTTFINSSGDLVLMICVYIAEFNFLVWFRNFIYTERFLYCKLAGIMCIYCYNSIKNFQPSLYVDIVILYFCLLLSCRRQEVDETLVVIIEMRDMWNPCTLF